MTQKSFLAEYGPRLLSQGFPIVPIKPGTKHPGFAGWQKTKADPNLLNRWLGGRFSRGGVGILTRHFPAVDLDVQDPELVDRLVASCAEHIGQTVQRVGQAPRQLLVFCTDAPFAKIASAKYADPNGGEHKVEILGDGQQFVAYATHPGTKRPYRWVSENGLADVGAAELPKITDRQARDLIAYFERIRPASWRLVEPAPAVRQSAQGAPELDLVLRPGKPKLDIETDSLEKALAFLDPDMRMQGWVRIGMALYHQFDGGDEGFRLWDVWSARSAKYVPGEMQARWRSFAADLRRTTPVTAASILRDARRKGWTPARKAPGATPTREAQGFGLIHARDVIARLGPIKWRIKDFLEENTTGLFFGDPGAYKSFIALDMAFHVAAGKDWHGYAVQQGTVIYIAGEGHGGLARRFAAWQQHHGIDLATLPLYASAQAA